MGGLEPSSALPCPLERIFRAPAFPRQLPETNLSICSLPSKLAKLVYRRRRYQRRASHWCLWIPLLDVHDLRQEAMDILSCWTGIPRNHIYSAKLYFWLVSKVSLNPYALVGIQALSRISWLHGPCLSCLAFHIARPTTLQEENKQEISTVWGTPQHFLGRKFLSWGTRNFLTRQDWESLDSARFTYVATQTWTEFIGPLQGKVNQPIMKNCLILNLFPVLSLHLAACSLYQLAARTKWRTWRTPSQCPATLSMNQT